MYLICNLKQTTSVWSDQVIWIDYSNFKQFEEMGFTLGILRAINDMGVEDPEVLKERNKGKRGRKKYRKSF